MAAGIHFPDNNETIDLQQQVARLQALLEASRQVHSTIREEEVLGAGAAHRGARAGDGRRGLSRHRPGLRRRCPIRLTADAHRALPIYPLARPRRQAHDRAGRRASRRPRAHPLRSRLHRGPGPAGRRRSRKRPQPQAQRRIRPRAAGSGRGRAHSALAAAAEAARDSRLLARPSAPTPATRWAATTSTSSSSPTAAC